jgi:hypothetical protein
MLLRRNSKFGSQKGIALLVALFALLLLSAIGMGMMFTANTGTMISANYREVQIATFGAYSGLWEGRDRLMYDTSTTNSMVTLPAGLPSTSAANVIYIINPSSGETIAPWDYSNTFADKELCHDNVLGLTGAAGIPCSGSSSLPSGSSWYTTYDDSSTSAYHLSNPLPFKWARITLKTDNMTTFPISGSASGAQVCWDGQHQVPIPSGYGSDCGPHSGSLGSINVTAVGSGYSSAPTVTITGGGGSGATATANMTYTSTGQVSAAAATNGGSNYTTAPTVTLTGGGGTGAAITAVIVPPGQPIASVSLTSAGSGCYGTGETPAVNYSGGGGSGASITANMVAGTCIYSMTVNGSCSAKKGLSGVAFTVTGGGGSNFAGTIDFKNGTGAVNASHVTATGDNYTSSPTAITLAGCAGLTVGSVTFGRVLSSTTPLNLVTGGGGFTSAPTLSVAVPSTNIGFTGSPATAGSGTTTLGTANPNAGQVTALNVTSGGSGYTSAPTVAFTGGGGTGAAATASIGQTGTVTSVTITNGGTGYTTAPTIGFTGGGGSGAVASSSLASGVYYGQVFLITSFGRSPAGARSMAQMEAVLPVRGMASTGALTLDGPNPTFNSPNSNNFNVIGTDANSCSGTAAAAKPAVGVYDDPNNPTTPSSQTTVTNALARPDHYYGAITPGPDVENVYNTLTSTMGTPSGLEAFGLAVKAIAQSASPSTAYVNPGSINMGTSATPVVAYVDGNVSFGGNVTGYGLLFVTGTLSMGGNFSWYGPIFVVGQGVAAFNGGGNGQIMGQLLVAKTRDASGTVLTDTVGLGAPSMTWNGGGGNGIQYDHCWVDNMMGRIPFTPPRSTKPLKVISIKSLAY